MQGRWGIGGSTYECIASSTCINAASRECISMVKIGDIGTSPLVSVIPLRVYCIALSEVCKIPAPWCSREVRATLRHTCTHVDGGDITDFQWSTSCRYNLLMMPCHVRTPNLMGEGGFAFAYYQLRIRDTVIHVKPGGITQETNTGHE